MLIAGVGSSLRACQQLVEEKGLQDRIFFHTPWPKKDTGIVLGAADVLLLPTQGEQSLVSVPSKLISYMLSGRPVLAMVLGNSETAKLIIKAKAGWVIPPDDPGTAAALKVIAASAPEDVRAAGARGLDYALSNLTREANLPQDDPALSSRPQNPEPCDRFSNFSDSGVPTVSKGLGCAGKRFFDLTVAIAALISRGADAWGDCRCYRASAPEDRSSSCRNVLVGRGEYFTSSSSDRWSTMRRIFATLTVVLIVRIQICA